MIAWYNLTHQLSNQTDLKYKYSDIITCWQNVTWSREWVGCWEYWFWVTGLKRWQILMFFIVLNFKEYSYLHNQMSDWDWVWIKIQHFKWTGDLCWKIKNWILPTCDSFPLIVSQISKKSQELAFTDDYWFKVFQYNHKITFVMRIASCQQK